MVGDRSAASKARSNGSNVQAEEKIGSPIILERSKSGGSDEFHGGKRLEKHESGSDSSADLPHRGGTSVRKVVDRFDDDAVGAALPAAPQRKPRRKCAENLNLGDENGTMLQQDVNHAEESSRNSGDVAVPSDASVGVLGLDTSVPYSKAIHNAGLGRTQSAKESSRTKDGRSPHDHDVEDHNSNYDRSKSVGLSRAKSAGMVVDTKILRAGRSGLSGWLSDIRSKMEIFEARLERALSQPLSRSSPITPMPILTYTSSGGIEELLRDISKKSGGGIESGQDPGMTSEHGGLDDDDQSPIEQVALIVPTTDDPTIPYWTFRSVVLGCFACAVITFLNTYFSYRTEPINITVTTLLIATAPLGQIMASKLPDRFIRIPFTQRGFSLNPGPFSMKEHGLITIFASAGSMRPGGVSVVNIIKVFLHGHIGFLPGFVVNITCELFGYSWAVFLYKFLVEPARFWWPSSLVNVSLVRALNLGEKRKGMPLLSFFYVCFAVTCAYYVIPGLFIPSLTSVSVICYIFKHNVLAQQLGSGSRGLGLGAFSLDWATISGFQGSPLIVPWAAVVNIFVGFVLQAYLVAPITYWKNWFHSKHYPIFSSDIFTRSGQMYDVSRITEKSHSKLKLNKSGLHDEGLPYFSAFYSMSMGFTFALFAAVCSQVIFFNGKDLVRTFKATITRKQPEPPDVHTRLMRKYPEIPFRWCALMFLGTHLAAIVNLVVYKNQLEMKWWGVFLASAVTTIMVVPICILIATTNQVANLGIIPQYIMGFISTGEPITNALFRTYSTVVCGRVGTYLANFKLGHYMKIPPRATFHAQLISSFIAALVSIAVAMWLTESIDNICDMSKLPRNTPWTCPPDRVFYDQVVMFGIAGPHRLLTKVGAPYRTLNYYFIPGFFLPIIPWLFSIAFPRRKWITLINGPLLIRGATLMPPSPVVNNAMWLIVALFFSIYVFNYRKKWWQRYNYVLSAALDAGTVVMALIIYYSLDEGKKVIHWWGMRANGDHCNVASCPTAPGVYRPGCPVH